MDLSEYLAAERGRCAHIARRLEISPAYLSQMAAGKRPIPPDVAVDLEEICDRHVRRWSMRPNDWFRIWRDLVGTEGAPAVSDRRPRHLSAVPGDRPQAG